MYIFQREDIYAFFRCLFLNTTVLHVAPSKSDYMSEFGRGSGYTLKMSNKIGFIYELADPRKFIYVYKRKNISRLIFLLLLGSYW